MSSIDARRRANPTEVRRTPSPPTVPRAAPFDEFVAPPPGAPVRPRPSPTTFAQPAPLTPAAIVPVDSVAARALLAVIAIMSLLSALTLGAVVLVRTAASDWQAQVSREMTIQVRPVEGRDIEADVARAAEVARAIPGIGQVRIYSREESVRLLEPWLGAGLTLAELPIPRMIVVNAAPSSAPDLVRLRERLAAEVPSASLDDHRAWVEHMQTMTRATIALGTGILALVLIAAVLLVAFATRGAMATNRAIVEVLHFVGAKNRYISAQFQRHFLLLGMKGAAMGGGAAIVLFLLAGYLGPQRALPGSVPDAAALVGSFALGPAGYAGILGLLILIAAVTAMASRWMVHRTLSAMD